MEQELSQSLLSKRKKSIQPSGHLESTLIKGFVWTMAIITFGILIWLIGYILISGVRFIKPSLFAWTYTTENVSMLPSMINTLIMTLITLAISLMLGIGAAIFLNEYLRPGSKAVKALMAVTETLAGVPSIVFGLFGMLFFVKALHLGISLLSGCLTLSLMVLPTIIQTSREALMALPDEYRQSSYGLGAGKLRTIVKILLPAAIPGIVSGVVLATGRILGETAALIYTTGTIAQIAINPMEAGSSLAVHMYKLMSEGLYFDQACAVAVVLVTLVLLLNLFSYAIEKRLRSHLMAD